MNKEKKNSILIILVSAILIATVINIKSVLFILGELETKSLKNFTDQSMIKVHIGLFTFFFHILIFYITALFNYSWKDKLLPRPLIKAGRVMVIVILNVFLFYIFALIEPQLIRLLFTGFYKWGNDLSLRDQQQLQQLVSGIGQRFTPVYFFFVNFTIAILASVEAYFIILLRKIRTAELENIRLKQEKSNAELAALKEQISPHFFFNTLNSLSSVIRTEKKSHSLDFVENLSQVYRYILDSETTDTVTISEELGFLEAYAYLLKKRFGDNLQIQIRVDKKLKNHRIPPMALQTLLENVVKHNQLSKATPVVIRIENQKDYLVVTNNILNKKGTKGHGLGLANLNKRYKMIADCEIEIQENADAFIVKLPIIKSGPKSKNG